MRKIFSAALALVCIWFASPSWAACNLFDPSLLFRGYWMNNPNGLTQDNNYRVVSLNLNPGTYTFSTDVPDTRLLRVYVNGAYQEFQNPIANNKYTFTVTQSGLFSIVFRGLTAATTIPYETQVQIEEGSTATEYTPYNPLCATCDGTIVNYTSATGTVSQAGTPTPDNPIYPTFYTQGNMVLRKVGDVADSYDATTGKITRRVGVKVLDGTENTINTYNMLQITAILNPAREKEAGWQRRGLCTHAVAGTATNSSRLVEIDATATYFGGDFGFTAASGKQWLRDQYAAGTPVTLYYPLAEPVEEDWPASYCETPIKIATTKYNETAFSPLNAALANAISVVDTVVSNTITQAASIATLQAQKQTRPNDIADDNEKCPAGKKCLLVEDASGIPHWYEIVEQYSRLPEGFTELQWIESTGSQWVNTEYKMTSDIVEYGIEIYGAPTSSTSLFGSETSSGITYSGVPYSSGSSVSVFIGRSSALGGVSFPASQWNTYTIKTTSATNLSVTLNGDTRDYVYSGGIQKEKPLYLFANNNFSNTQKASIRVRSFYIKDNGALVRDFVPAQNSDGKIGMYDLANGVFYENVGDGEFVAGPVAE